MVGGRMYRHRRRRTMHGSGFMDSVRKANDFLKSTQAVSKVAGALGGIVPGRAGQIIGKIGTTAGNLGYGRRRVHRRRRTMHGGGFMDTMRGINNFLKKSQVISKVAGALGGVIPYASNVSSIAGNLGYGRRRRVVHRRRRVAGGARTMAHKKKALEHALMLHALGSGLSLAGGRVRRTRRRRHY